MRRFTTLLAAMAAVVFMAVPVSAASGPASTASTASSSSSHSDAGQESQDAAEAADWFTSQRLAPNGAVDPNAYASAVAQAALLPTVGGAWTERTNLPGADGVDFSDRSDERCQQLRRG